MQQETSPIRLRPHHLLCLLNYVGQGYSKAFTTNLDLLVEELNQGDVTIQVVEGPDDICQPRLLDPMDKECHCYDEDISTQDDEALKELELHYNDRFVLSKTYISEKRALYKEKKIGKSCKNCPWYDLCTTTANCENFKNTLLD